MKTQELKDKVTLAIRDATKKWRKRRQSSNVQTSTANVQKKQRTNVATSCDNTNDTASASLTGLESATIERYSVANHSFHDVAVLPMADHQLAISTSNSANILLEHDTLSFNEQDHDFRDLRDETIRNDETDVLVDGNGNGLSQATSCVRKFTKKRPPNDETSYNMQILTANFMNALVDHKMEAKELKSDTDSSCNFMTEIDLALQMDPKDAACLQMNNDSPLSDFGEVAPHESLTSHPR
jgi:hypothetical protein